MRNLIVMLALVGLASSAYAAEGGSAELSHSGEFRVRHQLDMDRDGDGDNDATSENTTFTRFKLGNTFRAGDKITGQLTLIHQAAMGDNTMDAEDINHVRDTATTHEDNELVVQEAYGSWMASDELMLKVGRFGIDMGDGALISTNDYEQLPYFFEGMNVAYDTEFAKFNFYGVKHYDTGFVGNVDREGRSWILGVDLKSLPEVLKMVHFHLVQTNLDHAQGEKDDGTIDPDVMARENKMRYGVTVKGDTSGVDFKASYFGYSGEMEDNVDLSGMMMEAEVGYSMPEMMNFRFHVGYHMDSGDKDGNGGGENETYDPFFYYKHYNAGLQDVVMWGNLSYLHAGISVDPMEDVNVALAYYMFEATEEDGANNAIFTRNPGESDLGSEIDLSVTKKYDNGFKIGARYSMFSPGDGFTEEDTYSQFWLQGTMGF